MPTSIRPVAKGHAHTSRHRRAALVLASGLAVALTGVGGQAQQGATVETLPQGLPLALDDVAVVNAGGTLYSFGGHDADASPTKFDRIIRIDPSTGAGTDAGRLPYIAYHMAAATDGRYVWLFGGCGEPPVCNLDKISRFDKDTGDIQVLSTVLPEPRSGAAAVWTGQHVFLFGGAPMATVGQDILRFTPSTGVITKMAAKLDVGMYRSTAFWDGQHAFLLGGFTSAQEYVDDVWRYDPSQDRLEMRNAKFSSGRAHASLAWDGRYAYHLGGQRGSSNGGPTDEIVRYDPAADALVILPQTLPAPTSDLAGAWLDGAAYAVGGLVAGEEVDDVIRFRPSSSASTTSTTTASNRPPVAQFTFTVNGLGVTVDGGSSTDAEGSIAEYRWSWGDGTPESRGRNATHRYAAAGTYTIGLTVVDGAGATNTRTRSVTVTEAGTTTSSPAASTTSAEVTPDWTPEATPDGNASAPGGIAMFGLLSLAALAARRRRR